MFGRPAGTYRRTGGGTRRIVSDERGLEIYTAVRGGLSRYQARARFGLGLGTISQIMTGRGRWADVKRRGELAAIERPDAGDAPCPEESRESRETPSPGPEPATRESREPAADRS